MTDIIMLSSIENSIFASLKSDKNMLWIIYVLRDLDGLVNERNFSSCCFDSTVFLTSLWEPPFAKGTVYILRFATSRYYASLLDRMHG